ncbi:MAG: DNA/RNA nuclease SfsA [Alphaproteobacteria bacterium]
MRFPEPLIHGRLVRRYKRFLCDVEVDGEVVTAHCPNPGSMMGLLEPGSEAWLSPARDPARKLRYTWEMVRAAGELVGINTARTNAIVAEALSLGQIPELAGYPSLRREVRYGTASRIDLLLEEPGKPKCYVEVKNVTLKRHGGSAEFPDAVTARGAKHLRELIEMAGAGARAVMLYLVQRQDCESFRLAADIDPAYAAGFTRARAAGVEALCYACKVSPQSIELDRPLALALAGAREEARP